MRHAFRIPRVGVAVASAALVVACSQPAEPAKAPAPEQPPPVISLPPAPTQAPVLTRADLLAGVAQAASAHGAGSTYPKAVAELAGRRFALTMPFGCDGPAEAGAGASYTLDSAGRALKLSARPEQWTDTGWKQVFGDLGEVEALEGFWLRRPWLLESACPAKFPTLPGALPSPETVGLVRVFEAEGSRLLRRGDRPYEITRKVNPETPPPTDGFRLVLEGRIAGAKGQPVRCRSARPDQRPACLVAVEFDRVAIEDPQGETLAQWRD